MTSRQPKMKEEIPKLSPREVPEVLEFMSADQELREYIEEVRLRHPDVLETIEQLSERRHAALEAADKAVRARERPCGPFEVHQIRNDYNAIALYDAVGEEEFIKAGGSIETKRVFTIDGARFDAAVSFGRVSTQIAETVKTRKVAFKAIGKVWGS